MKKIAFLIYDITLLGGAENISLKLANELSLNYDVHVVSLFRSNNNPILDLNDNVKIHYLFSDCRSIPINLFRLINRLKVILKENDIKLLFSITAGVNTIAWIASRLSKTRWIYCEHSNLENKTYGKLHILRQYIGARFSDHIVCLTKRDLNNFSKMLKISINKLSVIPNFIDFKKVDNINYNSDSNKIISIGRLVSIKQFDHIIAIGKSLFRKHKEWSWDIYGDGELRENLQFLIDKENLGNHIFLKGKVKDIISILNNYSFLVMTSKYEGLPLSLLEAQYCKLPLISYDCPTGPGEIILDSQNGFLIEDQNLEMMESKIDYLISNKNCREHFSLNSHINLDFYSKKNILKLWGNLIEKFIGNRKC